MALDLFQTTMMANKLSNWGRWVGGGGGCSLNTIWTQNQSELQIVLKKASKNIIENTTNDFIHICSYLCVLP